MNEVMGDKLGGDTLYVQVARLHAESIKQGFLPTLGVPFLALLYEAIDADSNSALFIEQAAGKVTGFVAGGRGMGSIYRQMFKRWPLLVVALLPALLNLSKLKRVFEIVWFSRRQKKITDWPRAELLSIAVAESERGRGVAQRLYGLLAAKFVQQNESAFCIIVGDGLVDAHRFYQRMGALPIAKIVVHKGQGSTLYRQGLTILSEEI